MAKMSAHTINMASRAANWTLTDQNLLVSDIIPPLFGRYVKPCMEKLRED